MVNNLFEETLNLVRTSVQKNASGMTKIGEPANISAVTWLSQNLGYKLPHTYLNFLAKHDGVSLRTIDVFSFSQTLTTLFVFRDQFQTKGYWPVGGNGCGDYFVLDTQNMVDHDCPVLRIEHATEYLSSRNFSRNYLGLLAEASRSDVGSRCKPMKCCC